MISGIIWATRNVDAPGTFAENPWSAGMFYQWNRRVGWTSTNPMVGSNGSTTWDSSVPGVTWEDVNDPCPEGWRLPTATELQSLANRRHSWTTVNGVNGTFFGSGSNLIFLPAVGTRNSNGGWLDNIMNSGAYWSRTSSTSPNSRFLNMHHTHAEVSNGGRAHGMSVRCVSLKVPVTRVSLGTNITNSIIALQIGDTFTLTAYITPANATNRNVKWTSSDESIATVNTDGVISAVSVGTTTISVTTECGNLTASTEVVITYSEIGVEIDGIVWATRNVGVSGTFAPFVQNSGGFFSWSAGHNACPADWRLPTAAELRSLINAGSAWTTYNGVNGRTFGAFPNQIFLPASGFRASNGIFSSRDAGFYWSDTRPATNVNYLRFDSDGATIPNWSALNGLNIRCVAE